jgi:hypothetical protein
MKKYEPYVFRLPREIPLALDALFFEHPAYAVLLARQFYFILLELSRLPENTEYYLIISGTRVQILPDKLISTDPKVEIQLSARSQLLH